MLEAVDGRYIKSRILNKIRSKYNFINNGNSILQIKFVGFS